MSDTSPVSRIRKTLTRILASAPAAVPYAGQAYSTFRADADSEEVRQILEEIVTLTTEQREELSSLMLTANEAIDQLTNQLRRFASNPVEQKLVAVIPVGGRGGSMFPITSVMPKCLVYVGERTMLQHILNSFVPYPDVFKKVIVISRSFTAAIRENVRQGGYGEFVECREVDKNVPGALLDLRDELKDGPFLLHYNDILIDTVDWRFVWERFASARKHQGATAMLLCSSFYPVGIGVISEAEPEMLGSFDEKPHQMYASGLANIGVAIFDSKLLEYMRGDDEGVFEDSFRRVIDRRLPVSLFRVAEWHHVHELHDLYEIQRKRGELR